MGGTCSSSSSSRNGLVVLLYDRLFGLPNLCGGQLKCRHELSNDQALDACIQTTPLYLPNQYMSHGGKSGILECLKVNIPLNRSGIAFVLRTTSCAHGQGSKLSIYAMQASTHRNPTITRHQRNKRSVVLGLYPSTRRWYVPPPPTLFARVCPADYGTSHTTNVSHNDSLSLLVPFQHST